MLAFCREKLLQRPTCPEACRHSRQLVNRHSPQRQLRSKRSLQTRSDSSRQSVIERAVNSVTEVITKSPLNEGKKRFFQRLAGDYDPAAIQAKIDNLTKQHPVVVFSWTFCPFAKRAKGLLTEVGAQYTAVELDQLPDGKAIKAELGVLTNRTSVPNVFISGKSYGGMNDGPGISKLHAAGELVPLLQQAGAL